VDAVRIVNTFHELRDPTVMLDRLSRSLGPGGRLVIVDRSPRLSSSNAHEVERSLVVAELRRTGFEILTSKDGFIDRTGEDPWWLTVATTCPRVRCD
ncbi:MAG: class I SAM-dependent methyltransferase, partial [Bryobacteraceae bacterium]